MPARLGVVSGCLHAAVAELSSCKAKNIYYLTLYRGSARGPGLICDHQPSLLEAF